MTVTAVGAKGANGLTPGAIGGGYTSSNGGTGGLGASVSGVYTFTSAPSTLNIYVGGAGTGSVGGFNGGGNGYNTTNAGAGGGASDIRLNGTSLTDRIVVAGGGGGNSGCTSLAVTNINGGNGGAGGGGNGTNGVNSQSGGGGFGGSGSTGGATGTGCSFASGNAGGNGTSGIGGVGGMGPNVCQTYVCGGGGGGGYIGGGAGGGGTAGTPSCTLNDQGGGGGGAGGTSLTAGLTSSTFTNGINNGNGYVIISYSIGTQPTVSATGAITICTGATANISASGASSYSWSSGQTIASPAVSPTTTTIYTVTGTNGPGCSNTAVVTVSVNPTPIVSVNSGTICSGQSFTISPSGASTYTIGGGSNIVTPIANTSYNVVGANASGCTNTVVSNVSVNATPVISSIIANSPTICAGGNSLLNVNIASPSYTYCQGVYTNGTGFGDYISSVALNTLNNSSAGSATPFYTLYPQTGVTTTSLVAGNTYTLNLQAGTYTSNDLGAWIDYDQNGNLNDIGEKLGEQDNLGATPALATIIFTVPVNAKNGTARLRVREMDHGGINDMDPCASQSTYGETEDYMITISGGLSPAVTYSWTPSTFLSSTSLASVSATNATLTTAYTVTVTALNGCNSSSSSTLTVNALPTITVSSGAICVGDSYTIAASGATTFTSVPALAGPVVTPTTTTNYSITGTDANGCTSSVAAVSSVTVNALPTITVSSGAICAGNSYTIAANGATTYTSVPSLTGPVVTPTATTSYSITGTDANGCTSSVAAVSSVTVNALPMVMASTNSTLLCTGQAATLTATGATSYTWNTTATTPIISVSPTTTVTYTVNGTDGNGCGNVATVLQNVSLCTDIVTLSNNNSLVSIYPNPTNGLFTVELTTVSQVLVTNALGQVVITETLEVGKHNLDILNQANGVYFVKVIENNKQQVIKLIKE